MPPTHRGTGVIFWWFLVISILYYLAYSVCSVPQTALGYELSTDYNERTRIMGWASIFGLLGGLGVSWLYKLTLLPVFGPNEVVGVRWVGGMLAVVIFFTSMAPGIFCKERYAKAAEHPIWAHGQFPVHPEEPSLSRPGRGHACRRGHHHHGEPLPVLCGHLRDLRGK